MPSTLTPNLGLSKPADGDLAWGDDVRGAFDILDAKFPGGSPTIADGTVTEAMLGFDVATQAELNPVAAAATAAAAAASAAQTAADDVASDLTTHAGITATATGAGHITLQDVDARVLLAPPPSVPDGSITLAKLAFDPATQAELNTHAAIVAGTGGLQTTVGHTSFEAIQDMLSAFLVQGSGITLAYNDTSNTLTITLAIPAGTVTPAMLTFDPATQVELDAHAAVAATQSVAGHTTFEAIQDMLGSFLAASAPITATYDDTANTLTLSIADGSIAATKLNFDVATQAELDTHAALAAGQATTGHTSFEAIQDMLSAFLAASGGVTLAYNDASNTLTIGLTIPAGTVTPAMLSFDPATQAELDTHAAIAATQSLAGHTSFEAIQDMLGAFLLASGGITLSYSDVTDKLTIGLTIAPGTVTEAMLAFSVATQAELDTHAAIVATQAGNGHTSFESIQDMLATFLVAGAGATLTYDDVANTLTVAATGVLSSEAVQDIVGALVVGGSGITATYDDTANTLTITLAIPNTTITLPMLAFDVATQAELDAHAAIVATQAGSGHTSFESIQDMLATFLVAGAGATLTYDDVANTLTVAATGVLSSEAVQDIVGAMLVDSATLDFSYDDAGNTATAIIKPASVTTAMLNFDVATQAELDTHAAVAATQSVLGHTSFESIQDMLVTFLLGASPIGATYDDTANTLTLTIPDGAIAATKLNFDVATQAELDSEATQRLNGDLARPTGVAGAAGEVAWYDSATVLGIHAASIYRQASTGWLGYGTGTPIAPHNFAATNLGGAGGASGQAFLTQIKVAVPLLGNANVHYLLSEYDPATPQAATPIRSIVGTRLTMQATGTLSAANVAAAQPPLSLNINLRGINAVATNAGLDIIQGVSQGQLAQVINAGAGQMADASAAVGAVQNANGGLITTAAALRALQPTGGGGSTYGDIYGLYIENQSPTALGSTTINGAAYGIYQAGAANQNTFKGPVTLDNTSAHTGKASFNGGTAGIPRVFGGWPDKGTPLVETLTAPVYTADVDMTIVGIDGYAAVPGSGSSSTFDIDRLSGGSWNSIFSTPPSFASGASTPSGGTLVTTAISAGDKFRLRWTAVNAALAGTTIQLKAVTR